MTDTARDVIARAITTRPPFYGKWRLVKATPVLEPIPGAEKKFSEPIGREE